jgi:hypothetical protein
MLCSVKRKDGRSCSIPANRFVEGAWCCHVHDPKGVYQGHLRDRALDTAPRGPTGKKAKRTTESWTLARRRTWRASKVEGLRNWEAAMPRSGRPTPVAEAPLTAEEQYRRAQEPGQILAAVPYISRASTTLSC